MTLSKTNLLGLTKKELEQEVAKIGEKSFRSSQIWNWAFVRGITDFKSMSNISKASQEKLDENIFECHSLTVNFALDEAIWGTDFGWNNEFIIQQIKEFAYLYKNIKIMFS